MGREIRRVPEGWEHPMNKRNEFIPLYDEPYEPVAKKWLSDCILWAKGEHEDQRTETGEERPGYFWDWHGDPPSEESYRPEFETEPTWLRVYETVTEGTPVSPAFATADELIDYLCEHGDYWAKERGTPPPSRKAATQFVSGGWAPSMVISGGVVKCGIDACDDTAKAEGK